MQHHSNPYIWFQVLGSVCYNVEADWCCRNKVCQTNVKNIYDMTSQQWGSTPDNKDTKNYIDRHYRMIKKNYRPRNMEGRVGTNRNDRKYFQSKNARRTHKYPVNDATIYGRRLCNENKWHATCCIRSKKVEGHDQLCLGEAGRN